MGIWLQEQDISNAVGYPTLLACTDDDNTGAVNQTALAAIIDRGEQETLSWLIPEFGPAPINAIVLAQLVADPLLKYAALDYVVAFLYDRRPEYVRANRQDDSAMRLKAAKERMERILDARQRPVTAPTPPANVGGVVVDNANRIYVDSPDGSSNSGDY